MGAVVIRMLSQTLHGAREDAKARRALDEEELPTLATVGDQLLPLLTFGKK
jgi:hypothetical protein